MQENIYFRPQWIRPLGRCPVWWRARWQYFQIFFMPKFGCSRSGWWYFPLLSTLDEDVSQCNVLPPRGVCTAAVDVQCWSLVNVERNAAESFLKPRSTIIFMVNADAKSSASLVDCAVRWVYRYTNMLTCYFRDFLELESESDASLNPYLFQVMDMFTDSTM